MKLPNVVLWEYELANAALAYSTAMGTGNRSDIRLRRKELGEAARSFGRACEANLKRTGVE